VQFVALGRNPYLRDRCPVAVKIDGGSRATEEIDARGAAAAGLFGVFIN
jgi:hypothetical protein